MPARFFAPDLVGPDQPLALPPDEAAHLVRVLRLSGGDIVSVFDGRGVEYLARVETAEPRRVVVRPFESVKPPSEPKVALTVAQGLLKGRKFDAVVRDLTMVGAVAVQPLVTDHSEAHERDPERWMRVAVSKVVAANEMISTATSVLAREADRPNFSKSAPPPRTNAVALLAVACPHES